MSSSTDAYFIASLNAISLQINRYFAISIFLFGTLGNILNIVVLSQRSLRSNPCALLFLVSSVTGLIAILSGLTSTIMSTWNLDPTSTIVYLCKIRVFVAIGSRTASFWLILLATIDRWLLSCINVHHRQMSTLKNAKRGMISVFLISYVLYIQVLYCYETIISDAPRTCYGKTEMCRLFIDLSYASLSVLLPLLLMVVFALMTVSNIRQVRQRVEHANVRIERQLEVTNRHHRRSKKLDHHLLAMLLVQIMLLVLFAFPFSIERLYLTLTMNLSKSTTQTIIDNFIFNLFLLFTYVAIAMPFYIYTLTGGSVFRKVLRNLMRKMYKKIMCLRPEL